MVRTASEYGGIIKIVVGVSYEIKRLRQTILMYNTIKKKCNSFQHTSVHDMNSSERKIVKIENICGGVCVQIQKKITNLFFFY